MFMFNSNEPIKVAHVQKLVNQSILNDTLVTEMVNNSSSESKKNFGCLIKRETFQSNNIKIWAVKNIFPLAFTKYLSYSVKKKNNKVVNV